MYHARYLRSVGETVPSLLAALRLPGFARLATAYTVNELGNWLGDIALAVLVYDQTGSPLATAALFIGTRFLPAFIAPALAVRVEPIDTRWALALVYLAEAVAFAALALSVSHFTLALVVALATIDGTLASTGRSLTRAAAVSMLGSHGALRSGNAVLNFGFTGAAALGPAIAGLVVAGLGVQAALLLDAGSFVVVALMLASAKSLPAGITAPARWWSRLREGMRYVASRSRLRALLAAQGVALIFFTAVTPIEVVFAKETLGAGDFGFGALLASWGVGMVAGSVLFALGRHMRLGPLLFVSTLAVGAAYLGLAAAPTLLIGCLFSVMGGAGNGVQLVALISAIQELTAQDFQVRVASLLESIAAAMPGVGFLLGGATAALLSPRASYLVAGSGVVVVVIVSAIVVMRQERATVGAGAPPLGEGGATEHAAAGVADDDSTDGAAAMTPAPLPDGSRGMSHGEPDLAAGRHPSRSALAVLAIALPALAYIAVDLAGEARWDIPLLSLLLAFAIASDLTAATVSQQQIKISGSFLSIVVAIVLLGGCPAALIGVLTILIGWFRWREAPHRLLANITFYAAFPLLSGALFEMATTQLGATPGDGAFYLLVFGVFAVALALDFLMVAGYLAYLGGASIGESAREMLVPLLSSHLAAALLAVGVAYLYHHLDLAAIPLIGVVLLTFQYLMSALLKSEERAAALERQTEELRSSRQSLAAFVGAAPIVLWAVDRQGCFLLLEGEQRGALGLGSASVGRTSLFDLEQQVPELVEGTRRALEGESTARIVEAGGLTFDARFSPLRRGHPHAGVIGVATDITARVEAQREAEHLAERLGRAQRLESVGQIAGGIAHDFNNMLGVILAYTTFALDELDEGSPMRSDIEEIRSAADRAAHLTRDLLLFSRRQPAASKRIDLNETVTDTTRFLRRTLGEHVELRTELAPDLWGMTGDQGQLEQVLMNLALNARDAMPTGGRLTFATENRDVSPRDAARLGGLPPGSYVRLTVADTGTGMSDDVQAHVFDPFFTTKEVGRGTGLGLATVYGIVGKGGGHIGFSSKLGEGTVFEAHWPAVEGPKEPSPDVKPVSLPGSGETVLIAEDEDGVRKSTARILSRDGYRVIAVGGGQRALDELIRTGASIDLLLSDVVMPDMSGHELLARARARQPALRVLLMSGHGREVVRSDDAVGDAEPLAKPFTADVLLARVRQALTSDREPPCVDRGGGNGSRNAASAPSADEI